MDISVKDGVLTIRATLDKDGGNLSESGKNFTIHSTGGLKPLEGAEGFSLNVVVCRKNADYKKPSKR